MTRTLAMLAALVAATLGCGGSDHGSSGGAGPGGGGHGGSISSTEAGGSGGGDGGSWATGGGGGAPAKGPMKLISAGVPAFASSTDPASKPENAADDDPASVWSSTALPAWIAYDLSGVPAVERKKALVAWYDFQALDYLQPAPQAYMGLPIDYTVEIHHGAGGGDPPADGWTAVANVTGNERSSRHHLLDLDGANWVRVDVTKSSDPAKALLDVDVYSAPAGATNDWLFMGDSITFMSTQRAFSDLPALVTKARAGDVPGIIDAAIGGTNTTTADDAIVETMAGFPGRFVVLAYGTNDHPNEFKMESLVKKVIAAGKTPVVPHMPWSASSGDAGPAINAQIDALYAQYPEILRGPDLWKIFEGRTDWIPANDIHPNADGQEALRAAWADVIAKVDL